MEEVRKLKVLICPLDWGLGHATRCVPIIKNFLEKGYDVVIAVDLRPYDFLKAEFPDCRIIRFPGTKIKYHNKSNLLFALFSQIPKMLLGYFNERLLLKDIISKENPDIIFSDNRYGIRSKKVYSIFMTHQLKVAVPEKLPFADTILNWFLQSKIKKFDECWVPDFEQHMGLAGKLSHPRKLKFPVFYIGTLSRFKSSPNPNFLDPLMFDIVVILSGPEPQRTIMEEKIFSQVKNSGLKGIIIQGLPEKKEAYDLTPSIRVYSHLDSESMQKCIMQAEIIICRSGYSGIMDMVNLGKKAILIPTPGQTEQEYLASYLMDKKIFFSISQDKFDLLYAIEMSRNYPGMVLKNNYKLINEKITYLSSNPASPVLRAR